METTQPLTIRSVTVVYQDIFGEAPKIQGSKPFFFAKDALESLKKDPEKRKNTSQKRIERLIRYCKSKKNDFENGEARKLAEIASELEEILLTT